MMHQYREVLDHGMLILWIMIFENSSKFVRFWGGQGKYLPPSHHPRSPPAHESLDNNFITIPNLNNNLQNICALIIWLVGLRGLKKLRRWHVWVILLWVCSEIFRDIWIISQTCIVICIIQRDRGEYPSLLVANKSKFYHILSAISLKVDHLQPKSYQFIYNPRRFTGKIWWNSINPFTYILANFVKKVRCPHIFPNHFLKGDLNDQSPFSSSTTLKGSLVKLCCKSVNLFSCNLAKKKCRTDRPTDSLINSLKTLCALHLKVAEA